MWRLAIRFIASRLLLGRGAGAVGRGGAREAIVLETLEEGASVSEVARRHGVDASQVFKWRRDAGLRSRSPNSEPVTFAPLLIEQKDAPQPEPKEAPLPSGLIELELAGGRARIPVTAGREVILAIIDGLSMRRR